MKKLLSVYKPIGMTPLQLIYRLREQKPKYANEPIGYAGRLDPMAHGVMLLMIGEETKNRDQSLSLEKEYVFECILGLQTDTYDLLGYLEETKSKPVTVNVNLIVSSFVNNHIGKLTQAYPPFSSKTVDGKPLFWWAKNGKLGEIAIPTRDVEISEFVVLSEGKIIAVELEKKVCTNISLITGDFRQEEIQKRWDTFFATNIQDSFVTLKCHIVCSSGTYVRGLVHDLGEALGCGAVTTDILRTRVGEHMLDTSITLS